MPSPRPGWGHGAGEGDVLKALGAALGAADLVPMPLKGVAHDHVRLAGRGVIARVPRWSQQGLDPRTNLHYQAAAFTRAAASGHTPTLVDVLEPRDGLPMGALLVSEILGRPPRLPADMPAIARALASLHRLPLPPKKDRPPLASPDDPVAATLALVLKQAECFAHAGLEPAALARLAEELAAAQTMHSGVARIDAPIPITLVGADTHPGNFLIDEAGKAWFTDLEKMHYGHPAIDLAHASLYSSTLWDPDVAVVLTPDDVAAFHAAWEEAVPAALALAVRAWRKPLRRLTWLRSLSWMARWKIEGDRLSPGMPETLRSHLRERVTDVFRPAIIDAVRRDWA